MPGEARGGPPRGYSWPPFEPGNTAAQTHGADSPRVVRPLADRIVAELVAVAPWCAHPAFAAELQAWGWEEARVRLLQAWIDERGLLAEECEGALSQLERAQGRASRLRGNLGLSPASWARVLASLASTGGEALEGAEDEVEAMRAAGRELMARAELTEGES